jgi:hypothetical protein
VGGQGIGNPIVQMPGHPPFVVHMGDLASTLRIGALPSDPSTFQTIALGPDALAVPLLDGSPSWSDVVPSCFSVEGTDADYCASALVDTGTPEMFAELPAGPEPTLALMPTGVPVHVTVGEPGDVVATYTFVAGDSFVPPPNVFVVTRSAGAFSVLGTPAFQPFDVLFDQSQGLIGFAPQPPSP